MTGSMMNELRLCHLSTVHPRYDTRLALKQCPTLGTEFPGEVCLVVADGKGTEECDHYRIVDLGKMPNNKWLRIAAGNLRAIRFIFSVRPDVLHYHDPELLFAGLAGKLAGVKVIYDVHESVPEVILKRKWIPRWLRRPLSWLVAFSEVTVVRLLDRVVAATPEIEKRFNSKACVSIQNFPIVEELNTQGSRCFQDRPKRFVYLGGITKERAAIEMVRAIQFLDTETCVDMVGEFRPLSLRSELSVDDNPRVICHGFRPREEVATILANARAGLVLFHPKENHINSQPNKLFEYMSAGLPVIASDFPLWREIIDTVGSGLLVDPQSPSAIADAMTWILNNPKDAEEMGRNGQKAVEETYNWKIEGEKLVQLYRGLV